MPVMLMTAEDVERWLAGTMEEALALQKPTDDEAIMVQPPEKKVAYGSERSAVSVRQITALERRRDERGRWLQRAVAMLSQCSV
jgi:hypothetical protein